MKWLNDIKARHLSPESLRGRKLERGSIHKDLARLVEVIETEARTRQRYDIQTLKVENEELKRFCVDLQWMAKRYAEGRQTYAPSTVNNITRRLIEMGLPLNPCGEGTVWARDGGGRSFSSLSEEEWNKGEPLSKWDTIAYNEEFKALRAENQRLREAFKPIVERWRYVGFTKAGANPATDYYDIRVTHEQLAELHSAYAMHLVQDSADSEQT